MPLILDTVNVYGPAGDLPIGTNYFRFIHPAGSRTVVSFDVPAWNEFAIDIYPSTALDGPGVEKLAERGNYDRSRDDWTIDYQEDFEWILTGWAKESPPDWHKPWRQAYVGTGDVSDSISGGTHTLTTVVPFGDLPNGEYGAAFITVKRIIPL